MVTEVLSEMCGAGKRRRQKFGGVSCRKMGCKFNELTIHLALENKFNYFYILSLLA